MTESPPALSWGHININVEDLNRSIEFYQKLGFTVFMPGIPYLGIEEPAVKGMNTSAAAALGLPDGVQGRGCIMQLNDGFPKIDLTEFPDTRQSKPLTNVDLGLVRICLVSRDLLKDYEHLRGQGVRFLSEPQACLDRMADVATCVDPDGTLIELLQVYLEKWPRLE